MDRKEIAIVYVKRNSWIAGAYYLQNLISSLNLLEDIEKPVINVFCDSSFDFDELRKVTMYSFLNYAGTIKYPNWQRFVNYFYRIFAPNKSLIDGMDISRTKNIFIFPFFENRPYKSLKKILPWKPDFQEKYYPQFFSENQIKNREKWMRFYLSNKIPIVFSSQDACNDCKKFYPDFHPIARILPFAVFHPDYSSVSIEELKKKWGIIGDYFFVANQFWIHKNHLFLFKAYKKYLEKGGSNMLICSGALQDNRFPEYSNSIREYIAQNSLSNHIKILGFIDRKEQLCLMHNSYAVVQPSLFEGWSTVVEDAKAMNKFIFLSNLPVHIEQAPANVCYFNPNNEEELANKLISEKPSNYFHDYNVDRKTFAECFLSIINEYNK